MTEPASATPPSREHLGTTARASGRPHGDRRRQQIIDTAVALFSANGFNAVGLRDIARKVGLSQAGLLHHFPSKADLLHAVLRDREEKNTEEERRARGAGEDGIDAFLDTLRANEENPVLVQLFALLSAEGLSLEHPSHDWWVERYQAIVQEMHKSVAESLHGARLPDGVTAETVARWLVALADGMRIQWLLDRDRVNRAETVRQFVALLRGCTGGFAGGPPRG